MANLCDGVATNHQKILKNSRAYCEGVDYRFGGTAIEQPITGNPEDGIGSEAEASWDAVLDSRCGFWQELTGQIASYPSIFQFSGQDTAVFIEIIFYKVHAPPTSC